MNLTPGQLREVVGLSQDAFRHWKRVLRPLQNRNGYRPCFSPGDLLAVTIIKALQDSAGVSVGALVPSAQSLFALCGRTHWAELERSVLLFEVGKGRLSLVRQGARVSGERVICIHVLLGPLIERVRRWLCAEQPSVHQQYLRFPPVALRDGQRRTAVARSRS